MQNNKSSQKNNTLNNLIDLMFQKPNRLFVVSIENEDDKISYWDYYVPKIELKDY